MEYIYSILMKKYIYHMRSYTRASVEKNKCLIGKEL